jgi:cytokinin trans-hydroxylase
MPVEIQHRRRIAELDTLVLALIRARKDEYEEAGGVPAGRTLLSDEEALSAGAKPGHAAGATPGGDFLDIMLQSDAGFSDGEMMDQLKTMLMAGHETSAMMLTWCTFLITRSAEATRRAVAEVDEAWEASGSDGESLNWDGVNRLTSESAPDGTAQDTYLHWALHEAMRLFTPVPVLAKSATRQIEFAGSTAPAGTKVMVCCVALHSDESVWGEDAKEFRPERHCRRSMPASLRKAYPYAFVPFSVGQRECIGRRLALVEAKTILAYVLRHFELDLAPGQTKTPVTDSYMIPLRPEGGIRLTIKPRAASPVETASTA